jgi:hypothetical protein
MSVPTNEGTLDRARSVAELAGCLSLSLLLFPFEKCAKGFLLLMPQPRWVVDATVNLGDNAVCAIPHRISTTGDHLFIYELDYAPCSDNRTLASLRNHPIVVHSSSL